MLLLLSFSLSLYLSLFTSLSRTRSLSFSHTLSLSLSISCSLSRSLSLPLSLSLPVSLFFFPQSLSFRSLCLLLAHVSPCRCGSVSRFFYLFVLFISLSVSFSSLPPSLPLIAPGCLNFLSCYGLQALTGSACQHTSHETSCLPLSMIHTLHLTSDGKR